MKNKNYLNTSIHYDNYINLRFFYNKKLTKNELSIFKKYFNKHKII